MTKTFVGHGDFTATLIVTDAFGWPSSTSTTVTVVPDPTPIAALIRHAPTMNGIVDGSLEMMLGENVTLNSGGKVTGKLYTPGFPTVRLNGSPSLGATIDGVGSTSPNNYLVTLNSGSVVGTLVRRTDALTLPTVAAPSAPAGTRSVFLNSPSDQIGAWETVQNLTVNAPIGPVAMPAGAYGDITLNGSNRLVLGVAGATIPSVYDFQHLALNGSAIDIVGPVVLTVANGVSLNGSVGTAGHPEWLTFQIAQGGLTLNSNVAVSGTVLAPNGTVTVNSGASITGALAADRLAMNGGGVVKILSAVQLP